MWLQHLLVFLLVGGCLAAVGVQVARTLKGKKSRLGSCCAKGCSTEESKTQGVHFIPSDMLRKRS